MIKLYLKCKKARPTANITPLYPDNNGYCSGISPVSIN